MPISLESNDAIKLGLHSPFHHLPDLSTFNGIVDICYLFALLEFSNALSLWSYGPQDNNERQHMMFVQKRAHSLCQWVFRHYDLLDTKGGAVDYKTQFWWPLLVQIGCAFSQYKADVTEYQYTHAVLGDDCTAEKVEKLLDNVFCSPPDLWKMYQKEKEDPPRIFTTTPEEFTVHKRDIPHPVSVDESLDITSKTMY